MAGCSPAPFVFFQAFSLSSGHLLVSNYILPYSAWTYALFLGNPIATKVSMSVAIVFVRGWLQQSTCSSAFSSAAYQIGSRKKGWVGKFSRDQFMVWKKKISAGTQLHYNTTNVVDWSSIQCFPEGYFTNTFFKQCIKHCVILTTIISCRKYPSSFRIIISFISIFGYCLRQKAPKANQKRKLGKASCHSYWIRKVQAITRCSSTNSLLCFSSHFRNRQPGYRYIPTWFDRRRRWAVVWKGSSSNHRHYKELCCS